MTVRSRSRLSTGGTSGGDVTVTARDLGLLDTFPETARDLWMNKDIADFTEKLTRRVEAYQTVLLKVTTEADKG